FLQTDDVGRPFREPRGQVFNALLDRIDVPGGDPHGRSECCGRCDINHLLWRTGTDIPKLSWNYGVFPCNRFETRRASGTSNVLKHPVESWGNGAIGVPRRTAPEGADRAT